MSTSMVNIESTFPTDWSDVQVEGVPLHHDRMHFPLPISPLAISTTGAFEAGYTRAFREYNIPIQAYEVRSVNNYRFERTVMRQPASEQEAAEQGALVEATMQREIGRMLDRWFGEHYPQVVAHYERLRQVQPADASREEILAMLDEVDEIHSDLWAIHFRIAIPMLLSMQLFIELYAEILGGSAEEAHTLMVGGISETIKADFGLADLAELARTLQLDEMLLATPIGETRHALEASENGRTFLNHLNAYLEEYGLRQDLFDFNTPTWQEDPTFALASIRNYIQSGHDPKAEHEAIAKSAGIALDHARAKLAAYPEAMREQFDAFLQHARHGAFLQEEHNFYLDQRGSALLRLFYLDVGRHLHNQGVLAEPGEIFMLRIEEIRELLGEADPQLLAERTHALVVERRGELTRAAAMTPPPFLGDPTSVPPPPDSPVTRGLMAFFGGPPQRSEVPGQLKGNPGSRGVASGVARVARTLEEAADVRPGEILVALTTMPAWTPLFGVVAAVVTETGGALSHCAIVAREYGIPAVVGVFGATEAITTGQRITVDGSQGIVILNP